MAVYNDIPVRIEIMVNGLIAAKEGHNPHLADFLGGNFSAGKMAGYFARRPKEADEALYLCKNLGVVVQEGSVWNFVK